MQLNIVIRCVDIYKWFTPYIEKLYGKILLCGKSPAQAGCLAFVPSENCHRLKLLPL